MRQTSFRAVEELCTQLLHAKHDAARVNKLIADGIRQRLVDKDTLPLIVQKTAVTRGEWCLALQVLQCPHLDTHRVRRDDNIWSIVDKGVPNAPASKAAAHKALQAIFGPHRGKVSPRSIQ